MEFLLGEIPLKLEALNKISQKSIKAKYAFKLKDLVKVLTEKNKTYEETKNEIIKSLAKKNDNGDPIVENNMVTFEGENAVKATEQMNSLNSTKIEVEFTPFSIDDAGIEEIDINTAAILDGIITA